MRDGPELTAALAHWLEVAGPKSPADQERFRAICRKRGVPPQCLQAMALRRRWWRLSKEQRVYVQSIINAHFEAMPVEIKLNVKATMALLLDEELKLMLKTGDA